jgi:hypothetical protein
MDPLDQLARGLIEDFISGDKLQYYRIATKRWPRHNGTHTEARTERARQNVEADERDEKVARQDKQDGETATDASGRRKVQKIHPTIAWCLERGDEPLALDHLELRDVHKVKQEAQGDLLLSADRDLAEGRRRYIQP